LCCVEMSGKVEEAEEAEEAKEAEAKEAEYMRTERQDRRREAEEAEEAEKGGPVDERKMQLLRKCARVIWEHTFSTPGDRRRSVAAPVGDTHTYTHTYTHTNTLTQTH
jgi:hypothetical protein